MDIDDYLSKLNKDLDNNLQKISQRLDASGSSSCQFNTGSNDILSDNEGEMFCPECGSKIAKGSRFCSNCGTKIETDDWTKEVDGIIMTDSRVLAAKYGIEKKDVVKTLTDYITASSEQGIDWALLDIADHRRELGEGTWMDYSDILQGFIDKEGIKEGPSLSLFIIGGNDIIPQPAEENPCGNPMDDYESTVYADFYYCFHGRLPLDYLDFNRARCNVSRLPIEMVEVESTFENDVKDYLDRCLSIGCHINIGRAVMTSNIDWIPASREMSRNLPISHMENTEGEVLDNMYLSPDVLAQMENTDLASRYYSSLANADMLVFNLHGDCLPLNSGFYSTDLAFSIRMLNKSNASILNTVACWGGRYIKYKRKDSMLLNAIHNSGYMLYSGSCVPALGKCGDFTEDSSWRIRPAACSESFMGRYSEYLCLGTMRAGEAFLKAKCDYYNSSRKIENDEDILGTVLMFNLYGNPQIETSSDSRSIAQIQSHDGSKGLPEVHMQYSPMRKKVVFRNDVKRNEQKAILEDISSAVDANLQMIHKSITKDLYEKLGLAPGDLKSVEKFIKPGTCGIGASGYIYNYRKKLNYLSTEIRVKVDEQGKILDALQTK